MAVVKTVFTTCSTLDIVFVCLASSSSILWEMEEGRGGEGRERTVRDSREARRGMVDESLT